MLEFGISDPMNTYAFRLKGSLYSLRAALISIELLLAGAFSSGFFGGRPKACLRGRIPFLMLEVVYSRDLM